MGLDMFLHVTEKEEEAIYWRKANQIHGWFVNTLAEGVDECQLMRVQRYHLVQLQDICGRLLDTKSTELAMELLPPTGGCFFGTYSIDDWYWKDIQHTFDSLTELLDKITEDNQDDYQIDYQASW